MSRGTAPRVALIALVSAVALPFAVAFSPAASAEPQNRTVQVANNFFNPVPLDIEAGDTVFWVLDQGAQNHAVTLDRDGNGEFDNDELARTVELDSTPFSHPFTTAGKYDYFCHYHYMSDGMVGTITVQDAPPPTTTTTEPPTTTTTAPAPTTTTAPAPTTTTTRPRVTTTTTRPPGTTPTTQPPASASDDEPDTTNTTARATTTTGKATTTTGKKKPTTTTKPPETTTTSAPPALPAEWIPTPDMVPGGSPTTTTTAPELQAAADHRPKSGKGGGFPIAGAAGLGVLLLGGLGWAWYHRASRYLPA